MSSPMTILLRIIVVTVFLAGCAVSNNINTSGPVYYPKPPQAITTINAAESELALLLNTPVTINYYATQKFPSYPVLKDFVDKTNPNLGMATHINYLDDDPIMMIKANGIGVSGGKLVIPVFPLSFDELAGFPIRVAGTGIELPSKMTLFIHDSAERRQRVADLLFFIQQDIESYEKDKFVQFEKSAAFYRSLKTKPKMVEEQRKLIVQANSFNQQKNYDKAIEKYLKAVDFDPTSYPAAYYNLALLYAQQNNPHRAIFHMKQYLLLEPESKDARSAQDKIYEWELLMQK
jgi:tetratricopeptide (TPR) repeat protein